MSARNRLWEIAVSLRKHSGFVQSAFKSNIPVETIKLHLWNAASATVRSESTIHQYCSRIEDLMCFLEEREVPEKFWSGSESIFFLAEFLKKFSNSATVPSFIRACLTFFSKVLEIQWNLAHPLIMEAARIRRKHPINQAPAFDSWQIKDLEKIASDESTPTGMAITASALCLMTHASLRWNDTLSISDLSLDNGIIKGRILHPKTSANAQDFCCHEKGFKTVMWSHPIFFYREEYHAKRAEYPKYLFPAVDKEWNVIDSCAPKRQIEQRMRELIHKVGVPSGHQANSYTLHSPRNFYTNAGAQLGWNIESQTVLGRWTKSSTMPEHYTRGTGVLELQLRRDISERIGSGWEPAKSFQISNIPPPSTPHHGRQDTTGPCVTQLD